MMGSYDNQPGELGVGTDVAATLRDQIARSIEHLPPGHRLVLDLHHRRQLSFDEIGLLLLSSHECVRSICTEALGALSWTCRALGGRVVEGNPHHGSEARHG